MIIKKETFTYSRKFALGPGQERFEPLEIGDFIEVEFTPEDFMGEGGLEGARKRALLSLRNLVDGEVESIKGDFNRGKDQPKPEIKTGAEIKVEIITPAEAVPGARERAPQPPKDVETSDGEDGPDIVVWYGNEWTKDKWVSNQTTRSLEWLQGTDQYIDGNPKSKRYNKEAVHNNLLFRAVNHWLGKARAQETPTGKRK